MNIIQETLFPSPEHPENLYLRLERPDGQHRTAPDVDLSGGDGIKLGHRDSLSTDTFFGSFYTAYWHRFTAVRSLQLSLTLTGAGQLRVFEETGPGVNCLVSVDISSGGQAPVVVPLAPGVTPGGRIFVEFEASAPTQLRALDFVSAQNPVRDISLSIGLCTYNQEAYLSRTLRRLKALADREGALRQVYVINQGKPFQSPEVKAVLRGAKFKLVQQRNLGGAGGFTRSIVEAQKAAISASHHLLMDDDIILDERLIARSLRFLSFTDRQVALGAAMLDALRPAVIHEAGAYLRKDNTVVPYCHDVDVGRADQLSHFNTVVATDYNAWWFCILPLDGTRAAGLPVPVFIRGDDFEYGQRLARKDIPTVTLPGIAIWHAPFYASPPGWQDYYDLRNRLIFGATYPEKVAQLSTLRLARLLVEPVLAHQYMRAALRLRAVRHFLGGPRALFAKDPEALHAEITALAGSMAPKRLEDDLLKTRVSEGTKTTAPGRMGDILKTYVAVAFSLLFLPYKNRTPVFLVADAHPRNTRNRPYVMTNDPRSFHVRFTPARKTVVLSLLRAAKAILGFSLSSRAANQNWLQNVAEFHTTSSWDTLFCTAQQPVKGKTGNQQDPL